jgi:hypothetical protein
MIPKPTANLLIQSVTAELSDSSEVLRLMQIRRAEQSVRGGLFGQAANFAQVQAVYDEYKRRAEHILSCIQKVLQVSSFRRYKKLNSDLCDFFLAQCGIHSVDIDLIINEMPSSGKPSYAEFKDMLHKKLLAEVSLCAGGYIARNAEFGEGVKSKETRVEHLIRGIKNHKLLSIIMVLGISIIAISQVFESLEKLTGTFRRSLDLAEPVKIRRSTATFNAKIENFLKELRVHRDGNVRSVVEKNKELLGLELKVFEKNYDSTWCFQLMEPFLLVWSRDEGLRLGSHLVAIDVRSGRVVLRDDKFGCGILSVSFYSNAAASPQHVICCEYLAIVGTGTYGTADKIFAIDGDLIILCLEKPHTEYNSGWGAFVEDLVDFRLTNEVFVKDGIYEIRTIGAVALTKDLESDAITNAVKYHMLPEEHYRWDNVSRQFVQSAGRITHGENLLTSVYSDFATIKGDWFRKPRDIEPNHEVIGELFPEKDNEIMAQ